MANFPIYPFILDHQFLSWYIIYHISEHGDWFMTSRASQSSDQNIDINHHKSHKLLFEWGFYSAFIRQFGSPVIGTFSLCANLDPQIWTQICGDFDEMIRIPFG
jgi:hypothetical protein